MSQKFDITKIAIGEEFTFPEDYPDAHLAGQKAIRIHPPSAPLPEPVGDDPFTVINSLAQEALDALASDAPGLARNLLTDIVNYIDAECVGVGS